ncbi:universal stress protein [Sphingobium algorifonticola]|uniref:Universal stress protein n=1 Tax=Sphingobium algorifonticola TaxID=2008318 RepID=A0A437J4G3_9SPHN|nr:universal stress protein [Sphingobium algorifonticola]RVT39551.1 universal stress protein [Sphingobium algorifonticola]
MAIKDLLAVVDTGDKDEQFIKDALSFAEFHDAKLTFLVLSIIPTGDYGGMWGTPFVILQDFAEAVEIKEKRLAERTRLSNIEVRTISDQPGVMLTKAAVQARYADMVLFGPAEAYDYPPVRRETIESILFASGRPVLILPEGYQPRTFDSVALGWNASREATHALRDATAVAKPGAHVKVLVLDGRPSTKGHGSDPGADIARHLARHGFAADVVPLNALEKSDAQALVQGARQHGADVLALGAYGHSRLREMVLGGVTRELIAGAALPLLFSH